MAVLQALRDDPLTRYLARSTDDETAERAVTEYAQELLGSASSAELLFHVGDFGAAALSHRIPEELVSIQTAAGKEAYPAKPSKQYNRGRKLARMSLVLQHVLHIASCAVAFTCLLAQVIPPAGDQPSEEEVQDDRPRKLSLSFNKLKRQFLQVAYPAISQQALTVLIACICVSLNECDLAPS